MYPTHLEEPATTCFPKSRGRSIQCLACVPAALATCIVCLAAVEPARGECVPARADGPRLALSRSDTVLFREDFEHANTQGWVLHSPGSNASDGMWEIGDPVGTITDDAFQVPSQPEDPYEGAGCAFTGQNAGGHAGGGDVDGGVTYMLSPAFDLTGQSDVTLTYARWFFNRDVGLDPEDFFSVEISNDDGATWTTVEYLGSNDNANYWSTCGFSLDGLMNFTPTMRLRFGAADGRDYDYNLIEGAVDDITVSAVWPYGTGDFDDDGDVDLCDFGRFQECYADPLAVDCEAGNMAGDETIGPEDAEAIVNALTGPRQP